MAKFLREFFKKTGKIDSSKRRQASFTLLLSFIFQACGGANLLPLNEVVREGSGISQEELDAQKLSSARIQFHHSNFFSLTDPNSYSCAGDARFYLHPYQRDETGSSVQLGSYLNRSSVIKPNFISNISVDLTDASSSSDSNKANLCSIGGGKSSLPTATCATFDYGALDGISSTLGGNILIFGGLKGRNYANRLYSPSQTLSCGPLKPLNEVYGDPGEEYVNQSSPHLFALGVNTLPSNTATNPPHPLAPNLTESKKPISSWQKISATGVNQPLGALGSRLTLSRGLKQLLLVGGITPQDDELFISGRDLKDSWIFDLNTQQWEGVSGRVHARESIISQPVLEGTIVYSISKNPSSRANFGYTAVPGFAVNGFRTTDGVDSHAATGNIDTTDRILISGGVRTRSQGNLDYLSSVHKFNPTFGPEWIDVSNIGGVGPGFATQWLDTNPIQVLHNLDNGRLLSAGCSADPSPFMNFGSSPVRKPNGFGFLALAGGFFENRSTCGENDFILHYSKRNLETKIAHFAATPTYSLKTELPSNTIKLGQEIRPLDWLSEKPTITNTPIYSGGGHLLPGFDRSANELIYFGGVNCRSYLSIDSGSGDCPGEDGVPIAYQDGIFLMKPVADLTSTTSTKQDADGLPYAGMAAARGLDGVGEPMIIAWGGVQDGEDAGSPPGADGTRTGRKTNTSAFILHKDPRPTPPDSEYILSQELTLNSNSPAPLGAADATLIFSHVTGRFYLFGGVELEPNRRPVNHTWELTVTGANGTYEGFWRELTPEGGLTCSPYCPSARRSHRMVEANYHNFDPSSEYFSDCKDDKPCSFGIFMEGGVAQNGTTLGDRWMFDPTANGGNGHWQLVNESPPRRLAVATSVEYRLPFSGKKVHRAIAFGGETGLMDPTQAREDGVFLPPTLGDTLLFDFDQSSWHRPQLLGIGLKSTHLPDSSTPTEVSNFERKQYFKRDNFANTTSTYHPSLAVLSPPPLAGASMITRTHAPSASNESILEALKIPEVYLLGGRKKDGTFLSLNQVFKFCIGSPGENEDGRCDAYDAEDANASFDTPSAEYLGRWLLKEPFLPAGFTDPEKAVFLGETTYDSRRDKLILFGGLAPAQDSTQTKVTEKENVTPFGINGGISYVYEYTFPTKGLLPSTTSGLDTTHYGEWTRVSSCSGTLFPKGRFGHSLIYDQRNDQILVIGGETIDTNETSSLIQPWLKNGAQTNDSIPEIWAGKRSSIAGGFPCYDWSLLDNFGNLFNSTKSVNVPEGGLSYFAAAQVPSSGYNTGFYTLMDHACAGLGPSASKDFKQNKLRAGGVDIDINRSVLQEGESLLLNLTFYALGPDQRKPDGQFFQQNETPIFEIHLINSQGSSSRATSVAQPRHLFYSDSQEYPRVVHKLSVFSPVHPGIQQEQVIIPLGIDPNIDRIRIERYSGSSILVEATVHRMRGDK
jgi:hypothetical protein